MFTWWAIRQSRSKKDRTRLKAAQKLGFKNHPYSKQTLIKLLSDPKSQVRCEAAISLAKLNCPEAYEPAIALVSNSSIDLDERCRLVLAIGSMTDPMAVSSLEKFFMAPDPQIRNLVIHLLGIHQAPTTIPILFQHLGNESLDEHIPTALARKNPNELTSLLVRELKSQCPNRRSQAVRTFGKLGDPRFLPNLQEMLHDPSVNVAELALKAIFQISFPQPKEWDRTLSLGNARHLDHLESLGFVVEKEILDDRTEEIFDRSADGPCWVPGDCWGACPACQAKTPRTVVYKCTKVSVSLEKKILLQQTQEELCG